MKNVAQQLHSLKLIEPESAFAKRSRSLILSQKSGPKTFGLPAWIWAGALAAVLLSFSLYNLIYYAPKTVLSSFDSEGLKQEFNGLSINIQLKEISYQQSVNQAIASALTEIGDNQTRHLNPSLLEAEKSGADLENLTNPEIDDLLNQLVL